MLTYDLTTNEAKATYSQLNLSIQEKLKHTQSTFRNLVTKTRKKEERENQKLCVWLYEMRYLSSTAQLVEAHMTCGIFMLRLWRDILKLENSRLDCMKNAMEEFINLNSSIFQFDADKILQEITEVDNNYAQNIALDKFFKAKEISDLTSLGIESNYIERLAEWIPNKVVEFEWILKEGVIFMERGVFNQWLECYAIVVKSRFLHIFSLRPTIPFIEPIESLYLPKAKLMVNPNSDVYVEITENVRSGILGRLAPNKQVIIQMKDSDTLREWMELIQSIS